MHSVLKNMGERSELIFKQANFWFENVGDSKKCQNQVWLIFCLLYKYHVQQGQKAFETAWRWQKALEKGQKADPPIATFVCV